MSNELQANTQTGELLEVVVEETENYTVKQLPDGTFKKEMKYKRVHTNTPETDEEQIELYNIFNSDNNENVTPFSSMIGKEIRIEQFYTNPYTSFDEKTGINTHGVTTTLFDGEHYYATSSKSVYFTLLNLVESFGYPNTPDYKPIIVKVTGTRRNNGVQIDLELIGLEK